MLLPLTSMQQLVPCSLAWALAGSDVLLSGYCPRCLGVLLQENSAFSQFSTMQYKDAFGGNEQHHIAQPSTQGSIATDVIPCCTIQYQYTYLSRCVTKSKACKGRSTTCLFLFAGTLTPVAHGSHVTACTGAISMGSTSQKM